MVWYERTTGFVDVLRGNMTPSAEEFPGKKKHSADGARRM
jgi:hypothetical protein